MVYTLTYNPSIDYHIYLDQFELGRLNRTRRDSYFIGGKGINVSQVLNHLGIPNTALGFIAGFTGMEIDDELRRMGIYTDFVRLPEGHSRINIKMKGNEETEINADGPLIDAISMRRMYDKLAQIGPDDYFILAGSVSSHMGNDSFASLIAALPYRDTKVIIDTTGESLINSLAYHPFLIKPNLTELCDLFHEEFTPSDRDAIVKASKNLQMKGARNVLVSLGGDGAVLTAESGQVLYSPAPSGIVVNTVGAGDSMVAGFVAGYMERHDIEDAFYLGIGAGSATAFNEGLAGFDDILQFYRLIR